MIFPKMYVAEGMNLKHAYFNSKGVLLRPTFIFEPISAQNQWKKKTWMEFVVDWNLTHWGRVMHMRQ